MVYTSRYTSPPSLPGRENPPALQLMPDPASRVPMPRVIDAGERVRAAGEHADDILLAAQVLEGHHAAAAHHHVERLVARPRLDHDTRVHRIGSRAALLVVPGRQMDSAAHVRVVSWCGGVRKSAP